MSLPTAAPAPTTSRTPQRQRGRDRVAGLLAAAAALFAERGYEAATMTDIAAKAGSSIGSLYLFFPTKQALAHALLSDLAGTLSARLDALQPCLTGCPAATIADTLFDALAAFLREHPVYTALVDEAGDEAWLRDVRAHRRAQIVRLLGLATPALPTGQAERLAWLLPLLVRSVPAASGASPALQADLLLELRTMLRHHLQ